MELAEVTCPSCFETFSVVTPSFAELPAQLDYDCEVCCRPMVIDFASDGSAHASSLDD